MEINRRKILSLIFIKSKYIIIATLAFALLVFTVSSFLLPKEYTSSAKFLVIMDEGANKSAEANFVKEVTHSYLEIFDTLSFFSEVADIYNTNYDLEPLKASEIREMTVFKSAKNKDVPSFSVEVTTNSAEMSCAIAMTLSENMLIKAKRYTGLNKIELIDDPIVPEAPSSPNVLSNTAWGIFAGLLISGTFFICREILDTTVNSLDDINDEFKIPVLGVVPMAAGEKKDAELLPESFILKRTDKPDGYPCAGLEEAYRTIRTNLILRFESNNCHIVTVTSAQAGEGKTTSSINLAIAIGRFGKRVLLIDADLRKRETSALLGSEGNIGLTDILTDGVTPENAVIDSAYQCLDFLPAGKIISNPSEALASPLMKSFLSDAAKHYDFIIIDTAPINLVSDALPVIKISDGAIICAKEHEATVTELRKLVSNLKLINSGIIGLIYIGSESIFDMAKKQYYTKKSKSK